MVASARQIAFQVIRRVSRDRAYSHLALNAELDRHPELSSQDRRFAHELAFGTIRTQGTLDWLISRASGRSLDQIEGDVLYATRLGTYQLWQMSDTPAYAAVDESVKLAPKRARGFVNAVLRKLAVDMDDIWRSAASLKPAEYLSLKYSYPVWIVEMWTASYGQTETELLLDFGNRKAPQTLRVNSLVSKRDVVIADLQQAGVRVQPCHYSMDGIELSDIAGDESGIVDKMIEAGRLQPQGEASMLASHLLDPQAGETIIDTCAAPGTKAMHMAALMKNTGKIIAVEIHGSRANLIKDSSRRLKVTMVEVRVADATNLKVSEIGPADRIMVDAPCSGLGNLNKRPDARWRKQPADIARLVRLQRQILDSASGIVKPGGFMVYSTCTISEAENQANVRWFLSTHNDFEEVRAPLDLNIESAQADVGYQFLPMRHGTEGFYLAKLRRLED